MTYSWTFPIDLAGETDGFNFPGIQAFLNKPIISLAREVIQNSMDAKLGDEEPVIVKFELCNKKVNQIPNYEEYKKIVAKCSLEGNKTGADNVITFFKKANELLVYGSDLRILKITDKNTTGLQNQPVDRWDAFVKSVGVSAQSTKTAGGSFGIGKFAPYISSQLRTIFISSLFKKQSGNLELRTQGKAILISHSDAEGRHRGRGYWGIAKDVDDKLCTHVTDYSTDCPSWLHHCSEEEMLHENTGTTLHVLGFSDEWDHWENDLAISIIENFFDAIYRGNLVVEINDFQLDDTNIVEVFEEKYNSYMENSPLYKAKEIRRWDSRHRYLYASQEASNLGPGDNKYTIDSKVLDGLGSVKLQIVVGEDLPKKVAAIRNGMFITEEIHSTLTSFGGFKDFIAIFECTNDKGNKLLRSMENERHDAFVPMQLIDKKSQQKCRAALLELKNWIIEELEKVAEKEQVSVTQIDDLADYFGSESGLADESENSSEEIDILGSISTSQKKQKLKTYIVKEAISANDELDGNIDTLAPEGIRGEQPDKEPDFDTPGRGNEDADGADRATKFTIAKVHDFRLVPCEGGIFRAFFTPIVSGELEFQIIKSGSDSDDSSTGSLIDVVESGDVKLEDDYARANVQKGKRVSIDIRLKGNYQGAVAFNGRSLVKE
jgi:hypothetical protein